MSPKMGRPYSDNPKQMRVETRMTKEELEKLDYCCRVTGKSRSKIVREGIDVIYTKLHNLEKD